MHTTHDRLVAAGHARIAGHGYSGFSFADLATDVGIRKSSIHHHFPSKAALAVAVIDQSRARIVAAAAALDAEADAVAALRDYAGYWARCIADGSDAFCLAGVLAAEQPNLPAAVAEAVRSHFATLEAWLAAALALAKRQGRTSFDGMPDHAAERFIATVYGAMLIARVFESPTRFGRIVTAALGDLLGHPEPS